MTPQQLLNEMEVSYSSFDDKAHIKMFGSIGTWLLEHGFPTEGTKVLDMKSNRHYFYLDIIRTITDYDNS